jgi:hypothetical protein
MNNETRWNSTYMMIERALRKQTDIRAFIFATQEEEDGARRIPAEDILSSEDWRVLGEVNEILKPIYLQTMRTQGWGKGDSHGRLWEVVIGMEYLLEHFEDWKVFYSEVTEETMGETQVDAAERIATASANFRESNGRPSRVRRLPARFEEDEVYALPQRSQPPIFVESALPLHSRADYSTAEKRSASETSQKSTLPADHRAYIRASINNGWKKLNEYYDKLGESPLFAAAIILHPRFGISWLEATWVSEEQLACVLATVSTKAVAKQLEEASVGELPPNPTIEDLPKVVWKNRRFVQEDSLARKGAKGRKSWIRSHGMFFIELNHQDQPIGHVWCCSRCDTKGRPEFFSVQATSSAADHLRKAHRITPASQSSPSDDSAIDLQSHATPKRPRLDQSIIPKAKVKAVQELSVGFVIDSDVPFTIFEHKFLKELFYQFDHELALQIPWSSSSITRELQKIFESKADIIKAELGSALTKIHISFDLWTSPNRLAIMAVFAHFIDKFGNQQSRLLALRRQLGIHSGENLAETLFEIVQLWDIRGQVGTVISDNVTTNDTCLSYFYRQLDPSIRPADIKARRMRCYGHVLNLVARAFLFGKDAESFELESDINGMRGLQEQDLRHWRSKGPIGKLHNIVKFIRSSPQRSEYFKRIAHEQEDEGYHLCEESTAELEVILNNETRWNSTYMMIERALRKQTDIRAYIFALEGEKDEEKRIPADDIL